MKNIFKTIGPRWEEVPSVKAVTILRLSTSDEIVTFSGNSDKSLFCKKELEKYLGIENIHWLKQVHGNLVIELPESKITEADGAITSVPNVICAVRTGDCLPIVFTNIEGTRVAVAHAGWKGLHNGILSKIVAQFNENVDNILVWIGPGISQDSYEVGPEIKKSFVEIDEDFSIAFKQGIGDRCFADLYKIAKIQLKKLKLKPEHISGGDFDTFTNLDFHSSRREGVNSGRMATLVWINSN